MTLDSAVLSWPSAPSQVHAGRGWIDQYAFFGTEKVEFWPYHKCKRWAQKSGIRSKAEWYRWSKEGRIPQGIPGDPQSAFNLTGEWEGWGKFLGTGNRKGGWDYAYAKQWAQKSGIKSQAEWQQWSKEGRIPQGIPGSPLIVFTRTGEWEGWGKFLGTGYQRGGWDYAYAKKWAQKSGIRSSSEWQQWSKAGKIPQGIPGSPLIVFTRTGEWESWAIFLGKAT